ncbi:MAG: hypothetical protein JWP88_548 [Flaviaesturariibacter sp.]|nr:hypothetical protein [Flaviaesturariibacter sp.]
MKPAQRRFTRFYWIAVFAGLTCYSVIAGTQRKGQYKEVEGKVIEQVNMPFYRVVEGNIKSIDNYRPQIAYTDGKAAYTYIDKDRELKNGTVVQVLYEKADPSNALTYTALFWLDYNVLVPAFVIASFVFCVVLISITNYGKQRVIVPGELDDFFVSESASGVYTG